MKRESPVGVYALCVPASPCGGRGMSGAFRVPTSATGGSTSLAFLSAGYAPAPEGSDTLVAHGASRGFLMNSSSASPIGAAPHIRPSTAPMGLPSNLGRRHPTARALGYRSAAPSGLIYDLRHAKHVRYRRHTRAGVAFSTTWQPPKDPPYDPFAARLISQPGIYDCRKDYWPALGGPCTIPCSGRA